MRVSDVSAWSTCEAMALRSPPYVGRTNVAAWVGTLAHATLANVEIDAADYPQRLSFDSITKTAHHAIIQANIIADKARSLLIEQDWGVLSREEAMQNADFTGHLDIRAWHSKYGESIIDLKTGANIGAAWLQVGGYLLLSGESMPWGGVLHVQRQPIGKDVKGTLELRKAVPLVQAWTRQIQRISDIRDGAPPTYSPGQHCSRCRVTDCAVRAI